MGALPGIPKWHGGARIMPTPDVPDGIASWLESNNIADTEAVRTFFDALYGELKRHAHFALTHTPAAETLNTTGLVNETFLRLCAADPFPIHDRQHFLAVAAKTMRWVLMDFARARKRLRRGGEVARVGLDEAMVMSEHRADEVLALDGALESLAQLDPRLAAVVEQRVFGGLTNEEIAAALGVSTRTVKRDWRAAKAFLSTQLEAPPPMAAD
jgi:RNA polymerase sigma factor (TIGR02999 family)